MAELFGDALTALTVLIGALAVLATGGAAWFKVKARTAETDSKARVRAADAEIEKHKAEAELAMAQAQQLSRPSLPPGEMPWAAPLNQLKQSLEGLIRGVSAKLDQLDEKHDQTRVKLARLEGRMNGHGTKE